MAFGTTTLLVTLQKCSHNSKSKLIGTYKGIWILKDVFEEIYPEVGNRGKLRHSSFANGDLKLAKDSFGMPPLSPIFRGCMQGHENGGKINSFGDCLPILKFFPGEIRHFGM